MRRTGLWIFILVFCTLLVSDQTGYQDPGYQKSSADSLSWGVLIPSNATLGRAWEVPRNPMVEQPGENSAWMQSVRRGFALFMNTSKLAPSLAGGTMSCNNCHPNGGQREKAMPLVGVDRIFPDENKRAGRPLTLQERIIGCLLRSINATGSRDPAIVTHHENELEGSSLNADTKEVQDLAAYITWLSSGLQISKDIPWRGHNSLPASSLLPVEKLDPKLGKRYFNEWCAYCHDKDGQGTSIATDQIAGLLHIKPKHPGPLWGPNSWNDGAGAARTYTLAGMIRNWMPYLNPGLLTDEQAQHIAAFITSQSRPRFPYKDKDYLKGKIPPDAVYYKQPYSKNPLSGK
jgi:thiosulfate dehydrogenase